MKTNHFSANVKAIRLARGFTQADLAWRVECSQSTISEIEAGKSTRVDYRLAMSLAVALDAPLEKLSGKISKSALAKYRTPDKVSEVG